MNQHYPNTDANPNFAALEEAIQKFWEDKRIFEQSVEQRSPDNAYVFYDGPPFANGLPHYGHLLTGYVKDSVARYQTMRGKRVERRFGWDCHGLPAEMGAEKELGISGRAAIQDYGIGKFNEHCRSSVMKYASDWEYYVKRQGRWVDFAGDYKTMDMPFMESCLWAFKELYNKGLIYESMRVMPYSWAAETPVSNFETRIDNATREREDKAAFVKFKLKGVPKSVTFVLNGYDISSCYLIAWTTTPWTLPSNLALAVNLEQNYYVVPTGKNECVIANKKLVQPLLEADLKNSIHKDLDSTDPIDLDYMEFLKTAAAGKEIDEAVNSLLDHWVIPGELLVDLNYEPLFPYFAETENAFKVLDGSEFVTDGDGTGIVHMAPGFGEVDQACCNANGIETYVPVNEKGRYTDEIFDIAEGNEWGYPPLALKGLNVVAQTEGQCEAEPYKPEQLAKYGLVNLRILNWLKMRGMLAHQENYKHNYPHCWRTDTPLIYRAMSSWYVNVQQIKDNMAANNKTIHWIPDHVQSGQMGKGIESAPDWSISRNRFWGTPIPIWKSESGKIHVCGSIEELEKLSGQKITDLHRPYIDEVVLKIDGEDYHRIEDVFDCWFESGSMPYAQLHYPFENKEKFEKNFPADFITEYIAQTRGWFYTLQVLSAALFGCAPFKHVICHGVVIDEETGLKYSKRLKNYKDPREVMDQYGADALRFMMLASPVMRGADLAVDPDGKFIRDIVRLYMKPIWNAYHFFSLYANADGVKANIITTSDDVMDRYILAKCKAAVGQIKTSLDAYDTPTACTAISDFFEVLNNWYIRRSKERFWAEEAATKQTAYDALFTVLTHMVTASAPLLPFLSEAVYRGLHGEAESVHLQDYPDVDAINAAEDLVKEMDWVQDICNAALAIRNRAGIRVRQPLENLDLYGNKMTLAYVKGGPHDLIIRLNEYLAIIADEVNVKSVNTISDPAKFDSIANYKLQVLPPVLGKRLPHKMKEIIPASKKGDWSRLEDGSVKVAGEVLMDGEYTIHLEVQADYQEACEPLSSNDALVHLNLNITPELAAEGLARDMVRMIQQARKDADLHVSDRIALTLSLPEALKAALNHKDYIAEQTLAVSLDEGDAMASEHHFTHDVEGAPLTIGLSKAA